WWPLASSLACGAWLSTSPNAPFSEFSAMPELYGSKQQDKPSVKALAGPNIQLRNFTGKRHDKTFDKRIVEIAHITRHGRRCPILIEKTRGSYDSNQTNDCRDLARSGRNIDHDH